MRPKPQRIHAFTALMRRARDAHIAPYDNGEFDPYLLEENNVISPFFLLASSNFGRGLLERSERSELNIHLRMEHATKVN